MRGGRVKWAVVVERTQHRVGQLSGALPAVGEPFSGDGMLACAVSVHRRFPLRRQQADIVLMDADAANGSRIAISSTTAISVETIRRIPPHPNDREVTPERSGEARGLREMFAPFEPGKRLLW